MKIQTISKIVFMWAVALSLGCNAGVQFSPVDPEAVSNGDLQKTETFLFNSDLTAKVDILIVDDNSDSMSDAQAKMATRLGSFISSLGKLDWQIGITTTDISNGYFGMRGNLLPFDRSGLKILNKNVPNYEQLFANTIVRQETIDCAQTRRNCPSADERGMAAAIMAMEMHNTNNAGMFRPDADLILVMLTNEDEGSDGTDPKAVKAPQVINSVKTIFGPTKSFTAFGILIRPGDQACIEQQSIFAGKASYLVAQLAPLTGGLNGSICDRDYGPTLQSIGQRVRDGIKNVTLKYTPSDASKISVRVTPEDPTLTWTVVGKQIIFNHAPSQFSRVDVDYVH